MRILDAAGAPLDYEEIKIGEQVYLKGISSGIEESGWDSLERTKLFLKVRRSRPSAPLPPRPHACPCLCYPLPAYPHHTCTFPSQAPITTPLGGGVK